MTVVVATCTVTLASAATGLCLLGQGVPAMHSSSLYGTWWGRPTRRSACATSRVSRPGAHSPAGQHAQLQRGLLW